MASPTNLLCVKSPQKTTSNGISGTRSPGNNPFDDVFKKAENLSNELNFGNSPFKNLNVSFKDINRPSLAPLDLNSSDFLVRESLGILPNTALFRESLTAGLSNMSVKEILNDSSISPRESLGVLNLSAMDCGRESIGIFNIQNSFLRRSTGNELKENLNSKLDDFSFDHVENGLKTVKKSLLPTEQSLPELILSTSTTRETINSASLSGLNNAFILPHSRILSAVSSGSSGVSYNPYFNSRSLEEPSKISPSSSNKDVELSQLVLATTDPFNEAFQLSNGGNNIHSVSHILTSKSTNISFDSHVGNIRYRIQSLPVALEDNILVNLDLESKMSNVSFQGAMVCRGIEDEKEFDDSVFVEARKVASLIADTSFNADEKSFDSQEHNILDATPQPEWPSDLDSSHSHREDKAASPKLDKDDVLKQVDKMLGMQPVNLEEKLNLKGGSKNDSACSENIRTSPGNNAENQSCASNNFSQNLSKISRASPDGNNPGNQSCASNNFSENLSKITQTSEESASRLIENLSDILKENENLSQTQKKEGRQMLQRLASMLCDSNKSKSSPSAEDSGHSSVDDQHLEDNKGGKNEANTEAAIGNSEEVCQALDLSCKGKSPCSSEINRRLSMSKSPAPVGIPSPYLTPNRIATTNASSASIASNTSDPNKSKANHSNASNYSNASAKSGNVSSASRHSNISQGRASLGAAKLRKSKLGAVATRKGPLRAVLPVENMAKGTKGLLKENAESQVTPEKQDEGLKFGLSSKKTSTPIQEPKLKPMAASTPAQRQSKDPKEHVVLPLAKLKYNRSFSYQQRASSMSELSEKSKTRDSPLSSTKSAVSRSSAKVETTKLIRRNSLTEGVITTQKDTEGLMRTKRSFSTGKEPKILSALSKVRQNILSSPYYKPKKSIGSGQDDVLKENVKQIETVLKTCGQELKRLSMASKKLGKENHKP